MSRIGLVVAVFAFAAVAFVSPSRANAQARNPFGVQDVPNPDGPDVKAFASRTKIAGDAADANAAAWADKAIVGAKGNIDGAWASRWGGGSARGNWIAGTATVKSVRDRVYILYKDRTNAYLIDALRKGNSLVGRYANLGSPADSTPWVGLIVNDGRIDGVWTQGRWDLRRNLTAGEKSFDRLSADPANASSDEIRELRMLLQYLEERVQKLEAKGDR